MNSVDQKLKDLVKIYKLENGFKTPKIDCSTLHPNNFEKHKVLLVINVFKPFYGTGFFIYPLKTEKHGV